MTQLVVVVVGELVHDVAGVLFVGDGIGQSFLAAAHLKKCLR